MRDLDKNISYYLLILFVLIKENNLFMKKTPLFFQSQIKAHFDSSRIKIENLDAYRVCFWKTFDLNHRSIIS